MTTFGVLDLFLILRFEVFGILWVVGPRLKMRNTADKLANQ